MIFMTLKHEYLKSGKLSGGQQRRVSLACALIHSPPLLILDEPTVGVDPLLRRNIWSHLMSICKSGQTIIITTHYIEEARNANTVAFMRRGILLAQGHPDNFLNIYNSTNLEDVFLQLCRFQCNNSEEMLENLIKQNNNSKTERTNESDLKCRLQTNRVISPEFNENAFQKFKNAIIRKNEYKINSKSIKNTIYSIENNCDTNNDLVLTTNFRFIGKCSALLHKNFKRMTRKWTHLLFGALFPSMLLFVVIASIGAGPSNLNLAICDQELENVTDRWGELFLKNIDKKIFNIYRYKSLKEGMDSVKSGQNQAVIHINTNFTKALHLRFIYMIDANEDILEKCRLYVHIDRSNQIVALQIERYLYEAMVNFLTEAANISKINPQLLKIPIDFEDDVYGNKDDSLREFVIPGCYMACLFFASLLTMAQLVYEERKDGLLERSLVAGITASEFIISNLLTQLINVMLQVLILPTVPYIILRRQLTGSLLIFVPLAISQGLCGAAFGLLIAFVFSDLVQITLVGLFLFFCSIVTSGVLWPKENIASYLQFICDLMPNTLPVQSMRVLIYRESTIDYFEVYIGFIVTYVWFAFFVIISVLLLRRSF